VYDASEKAQHSAYMGGGKKQAFLARPEILSDRRSTKKRFRREKEWPPPKERQRLKKKELS